MACSMYQKQLSGKVSSVPDNCFDAEMGKNQKAIKVLQRLFDAKYGKLDYTSILYV